MKFKLFFRCVLILTVALVMTFKPASATTIDPLTLEQLVSQASFVGVVECETAGGIVAQYRVIESWKGAFVGTRFSLKIPVDFWEPQFPISLVGERSVVTAFSRPARSRIMSWSGAGAVPLWWRDIPYEYSLPLFQGKASVPTEPGKSYYAFGKQYSSYTEFQAKAKKILSLSPAETEVATLRSVLDKYESWRERPETENSKAQILRSQIATAVTAEQLSGALLLLAWQDSKAPISRILSQGGGALTLKFLQMRAAEYWPNGKEERDKVIREIQERLDAEKISQANPGLQPPVNGETVEEEIPAPNAGKLEMLRQALQAGDDQNGNFSRAFETLTRHDAMFVAQYLVNWKNPDLSPRNLDRGYTLGSYFARQVKDGRNKHLRALLTAHDPFIRVAGAVYLCFENREQGVAQLREFAKLPDDPGVWAALNLARRGDKAAMPRALRVLETAGDGSMTGVPHRNLQKRLLVLLSNSAKKSGVTQPLDGFVYTGEYNETLFAQKQAAFLKSWWQKHELQITLSDPWLPLLEEQKVD